MENNDNSRIFFTERLMEWHQVSNNRDLPWKNESDPYKIWLSEVILQQTRAQQGLPYYLRFIETFPTVSSLAAATDDDIFRIWQGLGYYSRCKNMIATARYISGSLNGVFPGTYDAIRALRGIGPYTAAAIASFAYGLPHAVVDGNVYRVLARYFRIDVPYDTTAGKALFSALAQDLLDAGNSGAYNQAIMDLGATVCSPRKPGCDNCPLAQGCQAQKGGVAELLPVRSKKIAVQTRYFHYVWLRYRDQFWIRKRTGKDIWENLHEPLLIETDAPMDTEVLQLSQDLKGTGFDFREARFLGRSSQRLTHRIIETRFFELPLKSDPTAFGQGGAWLSIEEMKNIAFPKTVLSFLKNNVYF